MNAGLVVCYGRVAANHRTGLYISVNEGRSLRHLSETPPFIIIRVRLCLLDNLLQSLCLHDAALAPGDVAAFEDDERRYR